MQSDRVGDTGAQECFPRFTRVAAHCDVHAVDARVALGPDGEGELGGGGVFGVHEDEREIAGCGAHAAAVCGGPVLSEGEGKGEDKRG